MNYMAHLKGYQIERRKTPISTNSIALYYILMEYNNDLGWMKWFTVPNSTLQGLTGLEIKSLQRARNELIQKKYIEYKKGTGNQAGSYLIARFDLQSDRQPDLQSDLQMSNSVTNNLTNNVTTLNKLNQTKLNKRVTNVTPKEKRPRFQKPTLEEVTSYCAEKAYTINPENFYNYYESNGWMVGKNKMVNWKAAVSKWENNQYGGSTKTAEPPRKHGETSYDLGELEKKLLYGGTNSTKEGA